VPHPTVVGPLFLLGQCVCAAQVITAIASSDMIHIPLRLGVASLFVLPLFGHEPAADLHLPKEPISQDLDSQIAGRTIHVTRPRARRASEHVVCASFQGGEIRESPAGVFVVNP
jgi:hypothetical protein